jgi:membrane protein DedA with SNARE-associated domain
VNELAESLAGSSAAQGVVILFSSTIFQDPATIAAGLLVATHRMAFPCALAALMAGITLGDLALYAAGRLAGPAVRRRWIPPERLDRAIRWFRRYGAAAVLAGRVLPGCRYPTFVAAGVLRAPFLTFLAAALCSSFVWTLLLLVGAILLGDTFRLLLDRMAWLVIASVVVVAVQLTLVRRRARRSLRQELDGIDVDELAPHVGASQVASDACHDPDAKARPPSSPRIAKKPPSRSMKRTVPSNTMDAPIGGRSLRTISRISISLPHFALPSTSRASKLTRRLSTENSEGRFVGS